MTLATLFLTALTAAWVQHPDATGPADDETVRFFRFRRDFEAKGPLEFAVTADERYVLFLDGKRIDRGPDRGSPDDWTCRTLRLSPADGTHRLEAVVWQVADAGPVAQLSCGRGGFALEAKGAYDAELTTGKATWRVGRIEGASFLPRHMRFVVFAFGKQFLDEGEGFTVREPSAWTDAKVVEPAVPDGFCWGLDASRHRVRETLLPQQVDRLVAPGSFKAAADVFATNNVWTAADAASGRLPELTALWREGRPLTVRPGERFRALIDLGDYYCAYPEIAVEGGGDGAEIRFGWSESLVGADGKKGDRDAFVGKGLERFSDVFRPRGGKSFYTTPWWRCGRWCTFEAKAGAEPVRIVSLKLAETRYPVEDRSSFACDDPSVAAIRPACVRTLQMCAHEMIFDCPYYEQQMYPADTRVQLRVHSVLSADDRLIRRAIGLFDRSRFADGLVPFNFPTRETQRGGSFTLCYLLMYGDYALWHDGAAWLRERIPGLRSTVAAIDGYTRDDGLIAGLPSWNFTDWVAEWPYGSPPDAETADRPSSVLNLFWSLALRSAATAERAAGDREVAALYEAKAARVAAAVRARFYDPARGLVADDLSKKHFSEHAQALAILAEAVTGDEATRCLDVRKAMNGVSRCSVYFTHYLFEAAFKLGRGDVFLEGLERWRDYRRQGLRTTPEHPGEPRSDCHAWGSSPLYFMQTGLAGIRPDAPGFARVRVAPCPGSLRTVRARLPHPRGFVEADLSFDGAIVSGTVDTPVAGIFVWGGRELPLEPGRNRVTNRVHPSAAAAVEQANGELLGRFLSPRGLLYDYVGELPTAKDCAEGRPNAMGWWSPIENGPMFTGPYLEAMTLKAKRTGSEDDRRTCRRLAEGLLLCSDVCDTPGMICRGVGADGRCHYPLGSDDQTVPWFMGLDAYVRLGFCPDDLRARIVAKMSEVGFALEKTGWRLPCDGAFAGDFRGNLASGGLPFRASTHYLFVLRSLADVTGEARWKAAYVRARDERYPCDGLAETRLDVCAYGAAFDGERSPKKFVLKPSRTWIYVSNVDCLAQLAAREEDPSAAARYREGLVRSAQAVRGFLAAAKDYPNTAERPFRYANWRTGWRWREQRTQKDAEAVAWQGNWDVLGTRKDLERRTLTTPLAAAAICAFAGTCGDEVDGVLAAYDYSTASISEFYLAPLAFETMEMGRKTR